MTNLLDVSLTEDGDEFTTNIPARDALLGLVVILVKGQLPAAMALQERVMKALSGNHG